MFWNIVYAVIGSIAGILIFLTVFNAIRHSPHKKIAFYEKAEKENCIAMGKLSCYLLVGTPEFPRHRLEYCYLVDDKPYFTTFSIDAKKQDGNKELDYFSPSQLIENRDFSQMIIYYDKQNPKNILFKDEIFASKETWKREKTPKNNRYRDIKKEWIGDGPVDLIDWGETK